MGKIAGFIKDVFSVLFLMRALPETHEEEIVERSVKKRGRKPGQKTAAKKASVSNPSNGKKVGPGRPRKDSSEKVIGKSKKKDAKKISSTTARKRGRPKKVSNAETGPIPDSKPESSKIQSSVILSEPDRSNKAVDIEQKSVQKPDTNEKTTGGTSSNSKKKPHKPKMKTNTKTSAGAKKRGRPKKNK